MEYNNLLKYINILSYDRYVLPVNKDDNSYIYPIIMPYINCKKVPVIYNKELFKMKLLPLLSRLDSQLENIEFVKGIIAVGTHGLTKFEGYSPYKYHRPVPSARGIHPCEIYFITGNKKVVIERYNPLEQVFEVIYSSKSGNSTKDLNVVIVGDNWRLAKYYGDFAYILGNLDAGHIFAQLTILSVKLGYNVDINYGIAHDIMGNCIKSIFENKGLSIYGTVCLTLKTNKDCISLDKKYITTIQRQSNYKNKIDSLKYFNELTLFGERQNENQNCIDRKIKLCKINKLNKYGNYHNCIYKEIGEVLYKRSSAHSHLGLMSIGKLDNIDIILSTIFNEMKAYITHTLIIEYINLYIYINEKDNRRLRGYYKYNIEKNDIEQVADALSSEQEWHRIIHDSHEFINVHTMPMVVYFSVNLEKVFGKYENRTISIMYMLSGELCQVISLVLTSFGLFTRPIKNINEKLIEDILNIDNNKERITYGLLLGKENICQQGENLNLF